MFKFLNSLLTRKGSKPTQNAEVGATSTPTESEVSEELQMVLKVTTEDMMQFPLMPYNLCMPIKRIVRKNVKPRAYMDITGGNKQVVVNELEKINRYIVESRLYSPALPKDLYIPTGEIVFAYQESQYTSTHLVCTPHTKKGKVAKYPLSLYFTTDIRNQLSTTHGELFYGIDGNVLKGNVYFWRNHIGHFYYFKTIGRTLLLHKVERSDPERQSCLKDTIFELK